MAMTFQEYIANPTGIGTAVMSYRKMYEDLYVDKWKLILTREGGKIEYKLYKDKHSCYCHIKIPSEIVPKFYYDVVIKMDITRDSMNLIDSPVQFFSNDPHFNYVFAYAFKHHKLTINELEYKMSKTSLTKKPIEKNPQLIINYVKTLFFAFIFMKNNGLFQRARYFDAPQFSGKAFNNIIQDTDSKVEDRKREAELLETKKKKTTTTKKSTATTIAMDKAETRLTKVNNISSIKNVKNIKNNKSINNIIRRK